MSKWNLLALTLGLLLVAAPFTKHQFAYATDAEYEDDEDDDDAPAAPKDDDVDVVVVTSKNWDETVKKSKFALVEFYAPWCGHCKSLKPEYAKAATVLKSAVPDAVIAKVDATQEESLGQKFGVQGYPTLKWFVDGELASDYNGPRDADGIVGWVKKKTGPPAVTVDDAEKLKALEAEAEVVVVGYFKALEGEVYNTFKSYAAKTEDVQFAQTTSADVAKAAGLDAHDTVAVVKNFAGEDRTTAVLATDIDTDSLTAFVKAEKMPPTIEFSQKNSDKIFNSGINKQMILWTTADDLKADAEVMKVYREASKKFKGQLVFVTVNNEGDGADPVTNFFGLKGATSPVLLGFFMEKNKKFRMEGDFTADNVAKFAESVVEGTAQAVLKSEAVPEDPYEDGVYKIVGKTVESVVLDENKDVLLEVYAPWCGHCKKLEPIYKKLAKRFKKVESVIIAKMDGTENEHPEIEVKGFPTILFYPAGSDRTPIVFEGGDRSLKALTKFIKTNAKIPYELPKKGSETDEGTSEDKDKPASDKDEL
ncbi:hypothetical protein HYH02_008213 [Chlamydomonas schloesseri]|uniref:Protein disulfide-isomerase n=1 Tax=Chlamydomonas schloesseri TaxID=2026947 RepID=A0A835WGB0_9CHLO|nr:hypothetical protein HYH02_008213 [Chlamydomonas schloesseri]|eukprot:KAG2446641.1 hypothetical protein HYH02_008213 [Chlamydomonas schloesseri]